MKKLSKLLPPTFAQGGGYLKNAIATPPSTFIELPVDLFKTPPVNKHWLSRRLIASNL